MLAEEMRKSASAAIEKVRLMYKQRAFELLLLDNLNEARQMAAAAEAMHQAALEVNKALRRVEEEADE